MSTTTVTPSQRTIAILGSTGVQGASVLHHLLEVLPADTTHFRALTQSDPTFAARSLPSLDTHANLSIHQADILEKGTLVEALKGSQIAFGNTNSQDPRFAKSGDQYTAELTAIKNFVDACVESGTVELLVLSSLSNLGFLSHRSWDFRAKSEGMEYAKEVSARETKLKGEKGLKVVFPQLGWYMNNFVWWHPGKKNEEDGVVEFEIPGADPNVQVEWVSTYTDLGLVVKGIIDNPTAYLNAEIGIVGDRLNLHEIAELYTKVTGQPARAVSRAPIIPHDESWPGPETTLTEAELQAAYFIAIYNSGAFMTNNSKPGQRVCDELVKNGSNGQRKMTSFEEWLRNTGYDAKKEGCGEEIQEASKKWGGRNFF